MQWSGHRCTHRYTHKCKLAGRLSTHTPKKTPTCFPFDYPQGYQTCFFLESAALSLAMVSTFDTLMCVTLTNRAHKKMWTWQRWNSWLRLNTVRASHCLCIFTSCLSLFVCISNPWSVCLSLCLAEVVLWPQLCCWDCVLGGNRNPRADWHKIPMVPSTRWFFFPASTHLPLMNK